MNNLLPYRSLKVAFLGSLFLFFTSCTNGNDYPICKIGNSVLTISELNKRIELYYPNLEENEAQKLAIEQWANQQRILLEMEDNMPKELMEQKVKLDEDLLQLNLYTLENKYISENLDTVISEKAIQNYYDQHRDNYKRESYIVRALYMKIPDTIAKIINADKYYLLKDTKDFNEINKIGNLYATSFYLEQNRWIYFEDLMREIPISTSQKEDLIRNQRHAIFFENGETHYVNILDYKTKSITSPLQVERAKIKQHILTIRSNQLREEAKVIILNNVRKKYPIDFY
ncbi:MAG: hypothetical protein H3C31_09430 [Brumimicrobium sp.]|nr:hypothetical protein [Brumimicrobium sp.]